MLTAIVTGIIVGLVVGVVANLVLWLFAPTIGEWKERRNGNRPD